MPENRKSPLPFVADVLDCIDKIQKYTEGMTFDQFLSDEKTRDAVERKMEIIGEAVKHISEDQKASFQEIPWRSIAGMRDKLSHEYWGVDLAIVWETIQTDLPLLRLGLTGDAPRRGGRRRIIQRVIFQTGAT